MEVCLAGEKKTNCIWNWCSMRAILNHLKAMVLEGNQTCSMFPELGLTWGSNKVQDKYRYQSLQETQILQQTFNELCDIRNTRDILRH